MSGGMGALRMLVPLAVSTALLVGCGGAGVKKSAQSGVDASGSKVFSDAGCGGCHTLKAAGASGTVGPNLDDLRPAADRVERQVQNGGNGMPSFKDKLDEQEIEDVANFVSTSAGSGSAKKFTFEPNDKKIEDCQGDAACYQQAFGNLSYNDGPKEALDRLASMSAKDPAVQASCHPISHMIGAGGLRYFDGNVGKAFAAGNGTCGSGYYHGLLQWKLAGVKESEAGKIAREACEDPTITANSFNYYQCVHGLGHGLMLYTGYELPIALTMC